MGTASVIHQMAVSRPMARVIEAGAGRPERWASQPAAVARSGVSQIRVWRREVSITVEEPSGFGGALASVEAFFRDEIGQFPCELTGSRAVSSG